MTSALGRDNSGKLFDNIKLKKKLASEGELAALIGEHRSVVSEIRHGRREISDALLVRICTATGLTLKAAQAQIADRE